MEFEKYETTCDVCGKEHLDLYEFHISPRYCSEDDAIRICKPCRVATIKNLQATLRAG